MIRPLRASFLLPLVALLMILPLHVGSDPAHAATRVERVVSPGGIEAWLVRETAVPVLSIDFAFVGGAAQDPGGKPGTAQLTAALLDEGAGDMDARAFHERMEELALEIGFDAGRDSFRGSMRTLLEHRDEGLRLLALALTRPRFDAEALERTRTQMLARLRRDSQNPNDIASRRWWAAAFPGHPYSRPTGGTLESVPLIGRDDLVAYHRRVLARDNLKIAVVGDIDAATLAPLLDRVFGGLPARADLARVPTVEPAAVGDRLVVDLDIPQAVISFGRGGLARKDPDFIPAFVLNHILGGGSFSSRLWREVRERRGLVYSVNSSLAPFDHAALFVGGLSTSNERVAEALQIIDVEIRRMAEQGPTDDELAKAKSFLIGSYALRFDTSRRIAAQLVQIQLDDLGIDYIQRRNSLVAAVTAEDVRRAARRLLGDGRLLVTIVGRPTGVAPIRTGG